MTFKEVQLQEILDIQWGDTKTTKASYVPDGYLAYSATGPDGFLDRYDYDREGIVLSAIGANCGSTFFASGKWSSIKNTIRIFPKNDAIDLKYFFYMTKAPDFWPIRGSAQPFISQTDIRELYVKIPEINVQRKIGEILFELESKISANNALSKTLEGIAQSIFKSWFVDFEPVKAKMAGEKPVGMDASTAALFPDSMQESELGLIPKGWNIQCIGDISKIEGGKMLSREEFKVDGMFPIFGGAGVMGHSNLSNAQGFVITVGRVGAYCGQFFYHRGSAWVNNNASRIIPLESISGEWVYLFLKSFDIESIKKGAAQPFVSNSDLANSKLMMPLIEIIERFTEIVRPIFEYSESIKYQSNLLTKLRDSLAPRLISGELNIPEEMLVS